MSAVLDGALDIATALTLLGLVASCVRLFLGPSRSDRVVALDLITVLLIAIASLAALRFDDAAYLDLGLTLALVGFLATVAFARYVESEPASGKPPAADTPAGDAGEVPGGNDVSGAAHGSPGSGAASVPHGASAADRPPATTQNDGRSGS